MTFYTLIENFLAPIVTSYFTLIINRVWGCFFIDVLKVNLDLSVIPFSFNAKLMFKNLVLKSLVLV